MLFLKQLNLLFDRTPGEFGATGLRPVRTARSAVATHRDPTLEEKARQILLQFGAITPAGRVQVEWNSRFRTGAGRANSARALISLNPRLLEHGPAEVDRTFRHELAHLLAHFRAGRRRIQPHGAEWQAACRDLGIEGEPRCHNLPFPIRRRVPRYLYRCPNCAADFPRVRPIRRATACLGCCRKHNRGKYHDRFRLRSISVREDRRAAPQ